MPCAPAARADPAADQVGGQDRRGHGQERQARAQRGQSKLLLEEQAEQEDQPVKADVDEEPDQDWGGEAALPEQRQRGHRVHRARLDPDEGRDR